MQAHLAEIYPDAAATLTALWRRYQLEYTWRATCQETYEPFEILTTKALRHVLAECGEKAEMKDIEQIMRHYETLDMYTPQPRPRYVYRALLRCCCSVVDVRFPDVEKTLQKLHDDSKFNLAMFSNGSPTTLQHAQSTHSILSSLFPPSKVLSIDAVRAYKPSRTAYNHLLKSTGKLDAPGEVVLISSNPFDICGAGTMGMRSIWINRSGAGWIDGLGGGPTWIMKGFGELAKFDAEK